MPRIAYLQAIAGTANILCEKHVVQGEALSTATKSTAASPSEELAHEPPPNIYAIAAMRRAVALLVAQAANALSIDLTLTKRLPLMPFGADEVLIPGQSRYLHLYEARFLSLFEYCTRECEDDVVLGFFAGDAALLKCATRARVDSWERLEVGVGVTVRGVARCSIRDIEQHGDQPFMVADVGVLEDADAVTMPARDANEESAVDIVKALADEVDTLSGKHDIATGRANEMVVDPRAMSEPDADVGRTTSLTKRASDLAQSARPGDCDETELLSFLALEGAPPDVKLKMLASTSRAERLAAARGELERQKAELAAKASLKSLNLSWGDDDKSS